MALAVQLLAIVVLAAQALLLVLLPWVQAGHEAAVRREAEVRRARDERRTRSAPALSILG